MEDCCNSKDKSIVMITMLFVIVVLVDIPFSFALSDSIERYALKLPLSLGAN